MATRRRAPEAEPRGSAPIPIQPVPSPILCNPYDEPSKHWRYDTTTGAATETPGRREASYWYRSERTSSGQLSLLAQEESDPLPLVNALRADVRRWRASDYENASAVSKQLLRHWARDDRARRLFFCQREAVETVVYLAEVLGAGRRPRVAQARAGKLRRTAVGARGPRRSAASPARPPLGGTARGGVAG